VTIKPICDICGKELEEFGAILLSPPDDYNKVEKFHLCRECYEEIKSMIRKFDNKNPNYMNEKLLI
jgi:hypothetical protein